eukprot:481720-Pleurochrysis_carterae.AAC.2
MRLDVILTGARLFCRRTLAPDQVPSIAREFAQQLEFKGDYEQAADMHSHPRKNARPRTHPHARTRATTHTSRRATTCASAHR